MLGGGGQVARAVAAAVPPQHTVVVKTRADLDITDAAAVAGALESGRFDWIVNGAAYTAVDLAEKEPEKAHASNATAVGHPCARRGQQRRTADPPVDGFRLRTVAPTAPICPPTRPRRSACTA